MKEHIFITVAELENRWSPHTRDEWGYGTDEADDDEVIQFRYAEDVGSYVPHVKDAYGMWQQVSNGVFDAELTFSHSV